MESSLTEDDNDLNQGYDDNNVKTPLVGGSTLIISTLGGQSILSELYSALYEARFLCPLLMVLSFVLTYHVTIAPYYALYASGYTAEKLSNIQQSLHLIRPVLSADQQARIRLLTINAETEVVFSHPPPPASSSYSVKLKFHPVTLEDYGTRHLPNLFYDGVLFGLTEGDSHDVEFTKSKNKSIISTTNSNLKQDLKEMYPRPTDVVNRVARYNDTTWIESGYAVYFSYDDLDKQGKLSSDPLQPWKQVADDILRIARDYHQVYVTVWYPHSFGECLATSDCGHDSEGRSNKHTYDVILQTIVPTRTGLDGIKSTSTVWMSGSNHTGANFSSTSAATGSGGSVYRKPWTEDEREKWKRDVNNSKAS